MSPQATIDNLCISVSPHKTYCLEWFKGLNTDNVGCAHADTKHLGEELA